MMDIIKYYKPKFRLLENVRMKKQSLDVLTQYMKCEPMFINSNLLSAQNRQRFYWFNWKAKQPEDKQIFLNDITLDNIDYNSARLVNRRINGSGSRADYNKNIPLKTYLETNKNNKKTNCLSTIDKDNILTTLPQGKYLYDELQHLVISGKFLKRLLESTDLKKGFSKINPEKAVCMTARQYANWKGTFLKNSDNVIRKLHAIECERLQTLPDNYTSGVSDSQRYKMLGNGWTCDVIKHIFQQNKKLMKDSHA